MAYESPGGIKLTALVAAADLSAEQYHFVVLDAAGDVAAASAQGSNAIGVLQNDPDTGEECEIVCVGVTKLKTDGTAHGEGDQLTTAADGEADAAASGDYVLGTAITSPAATAEEVFTAVVNCANAPILA
jgi:hypothetical protein